MSIISINLKDGSVANQRDIIVGIDLGTTNSLVAYIQEGAPVCVRDADGKNALVPSIVHFADNEAIVVGNAAKEKLITDPSNTIYSVKRLMGKSYQDLRAVEGFFSYKILDTDTEALVKIRVGDRFYSPVELSAHILRELKFRVEKALGASVSKAVITVPAYFNDTQRQATRDAGKLAGLDVLRIVNEPTAAALAYGIGQDKNQNETIAVYDLGGGTFDISILHIQDGIFEVLSTNGDTFLGGDDLDKCIINFWIDELKIDKKILTEEKLALSKIRIQAEEAKKALSTAPEFKTQIDGREISITRSTFEGLIQPLVQRTLDCSRQALKDAKIEAHQVQRVVMVGGSTRVPYIKQSVADFFGKPVYDAVNPDEVVALGAAIQADILAGNQQDVLLLDITPLSLGIETIGGLMDVIIPRNTKVPGKAGRQYTTSVDGQKNLKIAVYQGERDLVENNRKLGEFILRNIPPMPAGLPKIDIQFILNADGILTVRAKELRSDVAQEIEIRPTYGISEEEMAKMLLDSIMNAQGDMGIRGLVEARNEANMILLAGEKFLRQNEALLSSEEVSDTLALLNTLRESTQGSDKNTIQAAMDALNEYTTPLAHRAMDVNIANAMKGEKIV
jgi:molecular chaperone HscA